jgi:hypothetical protein
MRFAIRYDEKAKEKMDGADEILDVYVLNLLAMFAVLVFRVWLELKNYRLM